MSEHEIIMIASTHLPDVNKCFLNTYTVPVSIESEIKFGGRLDGRDDSVYYVCFRKRMFKNESKWVFESITN